MYNFDYYNSLDGLNGTTSLAAATAVVGILIAVISIALIIGIISYVFESISLYTIAKNRGIENPWLAWIPVANAFLLGKISDYYTVKETGKSNNFAIIMLCLSIATFVLPFTFIFALLAPFTAIALAVFEYISIYKFYRSVNPNNATLLLVLSIIFSIALPFILFAYRNKPDVYIPQQPQYAPAQPYQQPYQQSPYQQSPYQQNVYQQPVQPQTPVQPQAPAEQSPAQPQQDEKPDWEK